MPKFLNRRNFLIAGMLGLSLLFLGGNNHFSLEQEESLDIIRKDILTGSTFSVIASEAGVATSTASAILAEAKEVYDLAKIVAGKQIAFAYDKTTGALKELQYEINKEEKLLVTNTSTTSIENWEAKLIPIEYTTEISKAMGVIESSLYETITSQGLDERLALAIAETLAWQVDFAAQVQKGDSFKVIYEKRYREGVYDHPGKILAVEFINAGEKFQGYYFESPETKAGHYDEEGNSVQKVFLKAPLQYKYISSGYSLNRFNPILKKFTRHRGIDYAAPSGTPVVTVGDGTVVQAGWNGYYGIMVKVRHNEMYSTVYGHFSSIAKGIKVGTRVRQGQIVGYVGSTGLSTGPHLHYEMHRFGSLVNPFTETIPPGDPINEADLAAFNAMKEKYRQQLNEI